MGLVAILLCNFDSGPWDGAKWWEEVKEGASEYVRTSSPECGLFTGWLHWLKKEIPNGEVQLATNEGLLEVHATLGRRGATEDAEGWLLSMVRSHSGMRDLISVWTRRLIICLYLMIMLGNPRKNLLSDRIKLPLKPIQDAEDIEKSTTKIDRDEVRRIRSACKNGLEFVGRMLMKRELWQLLVIIEAVSRPVEHFFSEQNKRNKSAQESVEFWLECQRTKCFDHLNEVMSKLNDRELFQQLGLHVKGCNEMAFHGVDAQDPAVEAENDLCQQLGRIILAVTSRRLRSCAVHRGTPTGSPVSCTKASPPAL